MNVCDHISYNVGCLVEIFAGTPYIAFFDSLEVCKKFALLQKVIHAVNRIINRSIVYQIIRIDRPYIKIGG